MSSQPELISHNDESCPRRSLLANTAGSLALDLATMPTAALPNNVDHGIGLLQDHLQEHGLSADTTKAIDIGDPLLKVLRYGLYSAVELQRQPLVLDYADNYGTQFRNFVFDSPPSSEVYPSLGRMIRGGHRAGWQRLEQSPHDWRRASHLLDRLDEVLEPGIDPSTGVTFVPVGREAMSKGVEADFEGTAQAFMFTFAAGNSTEEVPWLTNADPAQIQALLFKLQPGYRRAFRSLFWTFYVQTHAFVDYTVMRLRQSLYSGELHFDHQSELRAPRPDEIKEKAPVLGCPLTFIQAETGRTALEEASDAAIDAGLHTGAYDLSNARAAWQRHPRRIATKEFVDTIRHSDKTAYRGDTPVNRMSLQFMKLLLG